MNKKLKEKSLKSFHSKYDVVIPAFLIVLLGAFVCYYISYAVKTDWLFPLLFLILEGLFAMGFIDICMKVAKGRKAKISDLTEKTNYFWKYIGVSIILSLIITLFLLLIVFTFNALISVLLNTGTINFILLIFLVLFGLTLTTIIIMLGIYIILAFSQVFNILYEEPKLSIEKIFSKSFDMMNGYVVDYFVLLASFVGWIILGIFTFGILYIWLIPYMFITSLNFYIKLKKEYKKYSGDELEDLIDDEASKQAAN